MKLRVHFIAVPVLQLLFPLRNRLKYIMLNRLTARLISRYPREKPSTGQ